MNREPEIRREIIAAHLDAARKEATRRGQALAETSPGDRTLGLLEIRALEWRLACERVMALRKLL